MFADFNLSIHEPRDAMETTLAGELQDQLDDSRLAIVSESLTTRSAGERSSSIDLAVGPTAGAGSWNAAIQWDRPLSDHGIIAGHEWYSPLYPHCHEGPATGGHRGSEVPFSLP